LPDCRLKTLRSLAFQSAILINNQQSSINN
jgi:hypothetical protein